MKFLLSIFVCVLACTANAEESWMYPVAIPTSPTQAELNSATMKVSYVESNGAKPFEGTRRVVHADVASFQDIVKWYSEQTGDTELPKVLKKFVERDEGEAKSGNGYTKDLSTIFSTHLAYRFTPAQKQITILHIEASGDVVAISLLGLEHETSIHVIRHRPNRQSISKNGDESSESPKDQASRVDNGNSTTSPR
ncbi:hypothetical protein SH528x_002942 [Novipirellula sp. SH528]|uniref:hypothetical protein n=1 Tax=Novipirellula sp. SH528 TaxID=3454466 RepID=UPI003FA0784A